MELSIYDLLRRTSFKYPDTVAVKFESQRITYKEFLFRVDSIALYLEKEGIHSGRIVSIIMKRSPELLATLFALLKLGATYVPIEPTLPEKRIIYLIKDSGSECVVSDQDCNYIKNKKVINMSIEKEITTYTEDIPQKSSPNYMKNTAYIIYTSGSTGDPKGVLITQESIINLIRNGTEEVGISFGKTIACISNISFDMSVPETILPLCKGLTVVLANEKEQINPVLMTKLIINNNVDILLIPPTRLEYLLSYNNDYVFLKRLTTVLLGAENISYNLLELIKTNSSAKIYNLYGPTEITAFATYCNLTKANDIHIGKPIKNMNVFILNEKQQKLGVNEKGEIYISGIGVGQGYVNKPELTQKNFVSIPSISENRIYKTGDLGVILPSGYIKYLGRKDNQVKFQGYRIELEEIEKVIIKYPGIKQCVTEINRDKNNEQWICSFFTSNNTINEQKLRSFLLDKLPIYMVPSHFICLESFPMNVNGKINRKKIKELVIQKGKTSEHKRDYKETIIYIINNILQTDFKNITLKISEIGMDSVRFIKMVSEIERRFEIEFDDDFLIYDKFKTIEDIINFVYIRLNRTQNKMFE
ncbi:amino acid adenylation domain-containing protein [Bacillus tequilensis]|uniref:non-ribosomal peptide synthetase n=1 Tax=Bacillus tequilensis TaxID=227866 RepID=UPI0015770F9E|nr:amino acid adenylation domain-containing protein [Bacillus tequilensis]NTU24948.1 amino acid adenylation domain-containing protein [Bacillus tequilensis]